MCTHRSKEGLSMLHKRFSAVQFCCCVSMLLFAGQRSVHNSVKLIQCSLKSTSSISPCSTTVQEDTLQKIIQGLTSSEEHRQAVDVMKPCAVRGLPMAPVDTVKHQHMVDFPTIPSFSISNLCWEMTTNTTTTTTQQQ